MTSRKRAIRAARRAAGIPRYTDAIRLRRGACPGRPLSGFLAGTRRKCPGRWAAVRVYIDLTDPRTRETRAQLECVECGALWGPAPTPVPLVSPDGTIRARVTIAQPGEVRRWRSRGAWHREGSGVSLLIDATPDDLTRAIDAWEIGHQRVIAARERAVARTAERNAEASARMARLLDLWHQRDADEAAAAAREAGGAA